MSVIKGDPSLPLDSIGSEALTADLPFDDLLMEETFVSRRNKKA